jgi:cytochrome c biogenesis protein CcdA
MTASLVSRFVLLAVGTGFLITGIADTVRGEWWGMIGLVGAVLILLGVALEASGVLPLARWSRRRTETTGSAGGGALVGGEIRSSRRPRPR